MHSLAPYSFRVHDTKLPGPVDDRYHKLNDIRGSDLVDLIHGFSNLISTKFLLIDTKKSKKSFKCSQVIADGREVFGLTESGSYGISGKVVDVQLGTTNYQKQQNDADIKELYFHFLIPTDSTVGVCVFHNINGGGVKATFLDQFNEYFRGITKGLILQMHPVSYIEAVQDLMKKSNVKELRLKQYTPKNTFTDLADQLTEHTSELTMKPKKRGDHFGSFWDLHKNNNHEGKNRGLIEQLNEECSSVSAVIELDGTKRVFSLSEGSNPISSIEFDEDDVVMEKGSPALQSLNAYSKKLLIDLIKTT